MGLGISRLGSDVKPDGQVVDPSVSQFEQSHSVRERNVCVFVDRTVRSIRDQEEMSRMPLHLHMSASFRPIREVALPDTMPCPLLLDQPRKGRGEQKDVGGAHQV